MGVEMGVEHSPAGGFGGQKLQAASRQIQNFFNVGCGRSLGFVITNPHDTNQFWSLLGRSNTALRLYGFLRAYK